MSTPEAVKKLSPEDIHDLAKHLEKSLHKHKEELHEQISGHLKTLKGDVQDHENKIPTSCKFYGFLILTAFSVASYFFGRKSAE
ncbi:hypothetical protein [Acetobacter oeni]|uniref:Uncharacterized protein n=1 Tax=Acetobacter oeni TaxID=304077 RepID=A0A511XJB0_9PROT|nr:hypothetical protein [Acetobacter oeni]MBB3882773.1 hypothetical protein [Acetobacter oeni]NHO18865.1 hypothetical protein [Acetobacter oeni]GBR06410.1 hypothetical protein AA21952_2012 [Acetobacter oeni LMG 21952]GEN63040.1 hypothetical protein AOE01nite_12640 [Acetobacter oeni]